MYSNRRAMLVVDMQKENAKDGKVPVEGFADVLSNAAHCIAVAREMGIPVIYSQHWLDAHGSDSRAYEPRNEAGRPRANIAGDLPTDICDEIRPLPGEVVVRKQRFSSFYNSALENVLRGRDIRELIILGVWTEACLGHTVLDASVRDYKIAVVHDACGSGSLGMHKSAILNIANWLFGGTMLASDQLQAFLKGEEFHGWRFREGFEFPFNAATMDEMYDSLSRTVVGPA